MDNRWWRNPWLWAVLFGVTCSVVAYGIHWQHGPFHDDYFLYSWSFRRLLGLIHVEVRPVAILFETVVFSSPEVVARLFGEAMLVGTALLSGLLLYRLFEIRLMAVSAVLLCLVPFAGAEATTWTSAVVHYVPAGFFALLALNLFLSSLREAAQSEKGRRLALLSGAVLVLAFCSIEPAANFYILFAGILLVELQSRPEESRYMLRMLALATLVILVSGVVIYLVFYVHANQVSRRGPFEIPSLAHIVGFLMGYLVRGISGTYGQELTRISFMEGWKSLLTESSALLLACGAIAAAVALNLSWKPEKISTERKSGLSVRLRIFMAVCLMTTFASMLLPSALLSHEDGSPRLAYLPGISGILLVACCIGWVVLLRKRTLQRIMLACVTVTTLVFSVHLLGYTRLYQLRHEYDELQLSALQKAVPPKSIAGMDITFLPYKIYENFFGYPTKTNPDFFLIGGFSSPNSVGTILEQGYPQTTVSVIRPGYGYFKWKISVARDRKLLLSGYKIDPPREVTPDNLIIFRYCRDGTAELARSIRFVDSKGSVVEIVKLPLAARLHKEYGTQTFTLDRQYRQVLLPPEAEKTLSCRLLGSLPGLPTGSVRINYGGEISLLGVTDTKVPGDRLEITYYWREMHELGAYDTVFVHFTDKADKILFQGDHPLCENRPFAALKGKVIQETQFIDITPAAEGKAVMLKIGLYDVSSRNYDRLKIESAAGAGTDDNNTRAIVKKLHL